MKAACKTAHQASGWRHSALLKLPLTLEPFSYILRDTVRARAKVNIHCADDLRISACQRLYVLFRAARWLVDQWIRLHVQNFDDNEHSAIRAAAIISMRLDHCIGQRAARSSQPSSSWRAWWCLPSCRNEALVLPTTWAQLHMPAAIKAQSIA